MPALISASGVTRRFGQTLALDDVSFSVEKGEVFGVFGPNGAGKTTLLRLLTGEIPPDSGELRVLGLEPFESSKRVKALTGIVPEVESPPSYLTAEEYFDFVLAVRGVKDGNARKKWFDFFDMKDRDTTLCRDLSKGTRQKLMLAGALVHDPELLLLDEPFINLDPIYQKRLREYLLERKTQGKTTYINTHILEIAQRLCTSVLIIDKGKVVAKGSMDDIMSHGDGKLEGLFMRVVGKEG